MKRREFLQRSTGALAAAAALSRQTLSAAEAQLDSAKSSGSALVIDPAPRFEISPWLYMQFMEPLGVTDSSVEASWSLDADDWRADFVAVTKDLAPDVMRWGGLLSRYYKWREGVGPAAKRPPYRNYVWGGWESHRVGTHEFVDFCRRVGAVPLYCVNFLSDGREFYAHMKEGNRTGDAREAADWVSYANDPEHPERRAHGSAEPYRIPLWQLGNETNYGLGGFKKDAAIAATIEFAKAMRERDRSIKLIGWGDNGWAGDMAEQAGEHLDMIAVHMMGQSPIRKDTVLKASDYQREPERAWEELMEMIPERIEKKLLALEADLDRRNSKLPIAITEGHLSLQPHNACPILNEWLTGVYHARAFNMYQRHGDRVHMATGADFNGTRWTVSAVMLPVPGGQSYLLPAGAVARLFKRHNGRHEVSVRSKPDALDVSASRTGDRLFLHVANMNYSGAVEAEFAVTGMKVAGGRVLSIAPENPRHEVNRTDVDALKPVETALPASERVRWRFPARSVSVVELEYQAV